MDLNQRKLIKSEWDSIEIPVSPDEIEVLKLITKGYHDVNLKINTTNMTRNATIGNVGDIGTNKTQ